MSKAARLIVAVSAAALLASCAAPSIGVVPKLRAGEIRVYHLRTEGESSINVPGLGSDETTLVEATVELQVVSATLVRVTLTPTVFKRNGRSTEKPPAEKGDLTLNQAGDIVRVTPGKNAQPPLGGSPEDLGALLGASIRRSEARLGDRWSRKRVSESGTGRASSRIAGLRFVDGRRCAIVATAASVPSLRTRETGGSTLRLDGTETSSTETAFAFDQGLPVRITSNAEGRYRVQGGQGGTVVVNTKTTVRLVSLTG